MTDACHMDDDDDEDANDDDDDHDNDDDDDDKDVDDDNDDDDADDDDDSEDDDDAEDDFEDDDDNNDADDNDDYDDDDDDDDDVIKPVKKPQSPWSLLLVSIIKLCQATSARKETCPSYGEPNKGIKERQRPTICYTYNHRHRLYLFFSPLSPAPGPMFVPVIVLLYPSI